MSEPPLHVLCRTHRDEFECFLGEDFDMYLTSMSRPGTWGDELTLVRDVTHSIADGSIQGRSRVTAALCCPSYEQEGVALPELVHLQL